MTRITKYHWHEALDRASMLAEIASDHLADHPAVMCNAEVREAVSAAVLHLSNAYQTIGKFAFDRPDITPLSNEQIDALFDELPGGVAGFIKEYGYRQFARLVERAHCIG